MKQNQNVNVPVKGMDTDSHPSRLSSESYVHALNTALEDSSGNGIPMLQNESSNILCTKFLQDYKVVGFRTSMVENRVYFWLANDITGRSQIGYVEGTPQTISIIDLEAECGCDIVKLLDTPLEENPDRYVETCTYKTLVGDDCKDDFGNFIQEVPCLNLSIDYPIMDGNITLKIEKTGTKIYWTDGVNGDRYLDTFKLGQGYYNKSGITVCDIEYNVSDVCLDCTKLAMTKMFEKPCLEPESLIVGGSLSMGVYQFLIAYSDLDGNELSPYYSMTNPVSIFDNNKVSMDDASLSDRTNLGIKLKVTGLDTSYPYYKVVVIKRNDAKFTESYLVEGVHPISEDTILYDREGVDNSRIELDRIMNIPPIYNTSGIMTSSGGYLMKADLTGHEEINIQKVVNLMGGFFKWKSGEAKEDLYKDGVNTSLYTGYMRDEVYPFGFRLLTNKGFVTPISPFIPRPPRPEEVALYNDGLNKKSLEKFTPRCADSERDKVWQFENTATINTAPPCFENVCDDPDLCEEVTSDFEKSCITKVYGIDEEVSLTWTFTPQGVYSGLLNALNADWTIIQQNDPTLYALMMGGFPMVNCQPSFNLADGSDCTIPIKVVGSDRVYVSEVLETATPIFTPKPLDDYEMLQDIPVSEEFEQSTCSRLLLNNAKPIRNSTLANTLATEIGIDDISRFNAMGCTVYARNEYNDTTSTKPCVKSLTLEPGNVNTKELFNRSIVYPGWELWIPRIHQGSLPSQNPIFYESECEIDFYLTLTGNAVDHTSDPCSGGSCDEQYYTAHMDYNLDMAFSKYSSNVDFTVPLNLSVYNKPEYNGKIASNATWLKIKKKDANPFLLEFSRSEETYEDYMTAKELRVSFFKSCTDLVSFDAELINTEEGKLLTITEDMFGVDGYLYIAVDTRLQAVYSIDQPRKGDGTEGDWKYRAIGFVNEYMDGCIKTTYRSEEYSQVSVFFNKLVVDKKQKWSTSCTYLKPTAGSCGVVGDKIGDFGYYESIKEYPDNKELYDSSDLIIKKSDIPDNIRETFEDYYVSTDVNIGEDYELDFNKTNFRCKPIRHYRFPDNNLVPFMSSVPTNVASDVVSIYPLGVHIDNEVVDAFLNVAVSNNLISQEFKDSIIGYEILRGDRTLDRSIIAKGLLFDVYEYEEGGKKALYSNYPYNDLGDDLLNTSDPNRFNPIQHPYNGNSNNKFTFHSPDLHFNPPTILPTELRFNGYVFGKSRGVFAEVQDHPKWVILGDRAYSTANTLAIMECVTEAVISAAQAASNAQVWGGLAGVSLGLPAFIASGVILGFSTVASVMFKYARYRNEWLETFKNLGTPKNFASYYTSVGYYNYYNSHVDETSNNSIRGIGFSKLMRQGNHGIIEKFGNSGNTHRDYMFNNTDREFTYYLSLGVGFNINYDDAYKTYDNNRIDRTTSSKMFNSEAIGCGGVNYVGTSNEITRNIASPYVTLKNYSTSQYGSLNSIRWVNTNYCGRLKEDVIVDETARILEKQLVDNCEDIVFGGDTYISRFSLKRKFPFFYVNAMKEPDLLPFNYAAYRNVGYPKFYVDYGVDGDMSLGSISMPSMLGDYKFDCLTGKNSFYVKPPSKFYLFYYGIPNFLVESTINCNFRYAGRELHEEFFPQTGSYVDWTQESKVSIKTPESFKYNNVYSQRAVLSGSALNRMLPINFDAAYWRNANNLENVLIYSEKDSSELQMFDPWGVYRTNNKFQFDTSNGKLIDVRGIESEQVLVRFENTVEVHNAVDELRERLNSNTVHSGGGTLFKTRPKTFNNTDGGYGGTQHKALLSMEFGHMWADAMRGQVFMVDPNGRNLTEITTGKRNWFKEHLPFKIIKTVAGMTHLDVDNPFKGLGLVFGYDSRFKRIFLTKRDYIAKVQGIFHDKGHFYVKENDVDVEVSLTDGTYFEDVSFTMAYSPMTKSWISYYSFHPDYYISYHNYFQSGLNFAKDEREVGLWSHLLTNKSYQVFYGKKYPWTLELPFQNNNVNKIAESVSYWLDSRRYHNDYDFAEKRNEGFNKAWIFNHSNNSGQLDLVVGQKNNLFQQTQYPKFTGASNEILVTEEDKHWSFNYFFNEVRNELNNNPIWLYDKNSIHKYINIDALNYRNPWKDRLRGDWFNVILTQDKETRFKYIFKWINFKENLYEN